MNGIELCRRIRSSELYRSAPILMITSMLEKRYIDEAFRAGASDYITKPLDTVEIMTRVGLAERQFQADRKVREIGAELDGLRAQIDSQYRAPLSEPVALEGIDGLIDFLALENYLLQLSRGSFYATSLLGLKIVDVDNLHARLSPVAFRDVLMDVAECALGVLKGPDLMLSYAGKGVFVGVLGFTERRDFDETELMVNLMLDQLALIDDNGSPLQVRVAAGEVRQVGMLKSGNGAVMLLRKVVDDLAATSLRPGPSRARKTRATKTILRVLTRSL